MHAISFRSLLFILILIAFPINAFAYIDPGTGSMILQFFLFTIAGVAVFFKQIWAMVRGIFSSSRPTTKR